MLSFILKKKDDGPARSRDRLLKCDDRENTLLTNWHWLAGTEGEEGGEQEDVEEGEEEGGEEGGETGLLSEPQNLFYE